VKYTDPDGKITIDTENQVVYADLDDLEDLNAACTVLGSLPGYKAVASDRDGNSKTFGNYGEMLRYMEEIDPSGSGFNIGSSERTTQIGFGAGLFLVIRLNLEVGYCHSENGGSDIYITGGIGCGFGASTKFTVNVNSIKDGDMHKTIGQTTTIGLGLAVNYDMKNKEFIGVSGLAVGGGVLYSGTVTIGGLASDIFNWINRK
jgi:hypothetical protein